MLTTLWEAGKLSWAYLLSVRLIFWISHLTCLIHYVLPLLAQFSLSPTNLRGGEWTNHLTFVLLPISTLVVVDCFDFWTANDWVISNRQGKKASAQSAFPVNWGYHDYRSYYYITRRRKEKRRRGVGEGGGRRRRKRSRRRRRKRKKRLKSVSRSWDGWFKVPVTSVRPVHEILSVLHETFHCVFSLPMAVSDCKGFASYHRMRSLGGELSPLTDHSGIPLTVGPQP